MSNYIHYRVCDEINYSFSGINGCIHDDVIKWKHFPRNWPFVREIHRSPVNFPHKGQWRGALMFSLIYAWINDWVNNREAGELRRQHGHYDVIVMSWRFGNGYLHGCFMLPVRCLEYLSIRRSTITSSNTDLLLIGPSSLTNVNDIWTKIQNNSFQKCIWKSFRVTIRTYLRWE